MIGPNLSFLMLAASLALPFAYPKLLRQPAVIRAAGHKSEREEEEEHKVISGRNQASRVNEGHRDLPAADWEPWPEDRFPHLKIIHSLCGEWVDVLEEVAETWEGLANTGMMISLESEGCNPKINSDLTYIDDVIHVVYGKCGGCNSCGGRANVEYEWDEWPGPISKYAVLVRIDKTCVEDDDYDGMKYILCHEIGHALGLGHNYDGDSCLGKYSDSDTPGEDDKETLEELYGVNVFSPGLAQTASCNKGKIFELILETDDYGKETSWDIKDDNQNIIAQGSNYASASEYTETECLDADSSFLFTIYDSYGDGICCSHGEGSYIVKYDGNTLKSGGSFENSESVRLGQAARSATGSCKKFTLMLKTDSWGSETSFYVKDSSNNVIAQGSGYGDNTEYVEEECLEDNETYTFTIEDTWGDGIVDEGYYRIEYDGSRIHTGGDFEYSETVEFGT